MPSVIADQAYHPLSTVAYVVNLSVLPTAVQGSALHEPS